MQVVSYPSVSYYLLFRKKYTDVETIDLVLIISKLSLDKNLIW